jgi:hypothetical protein
MGRFVRSAGRAWLFEIIDYQFSVLVGPVGMWAKASISPFFELARETGEAPPVGAADRPHIHRPFSCRLYRGVTKASGC